jgi:hypothetical protein
VRLCASVCACVSVCLCGVSALSPGSSYVCVRLRWPAFVCVCLRWSALACVRLCLSLSICVCVCRVCLWLMRVLLRDYSVFISPDSAFLFIDLYHVVVCICIYFVYLILGNKISGMYIEHTIESRYSFSGSFPAFWGWREKEGHDKDSGVRKQRNAQSFFFLKRRKFQLEICKF